MELTRSSMLGIMHYISPLMVLISTICFESNNNAKKITKFNVN